MFFHYCPLGAIPDKMAHTMAESDILSNQQIIIDNQKAILANQTQIQDNQKALQQILDNQEKILALLTK